MLWLINQISSLEEKIKSRELNKTGFDEELIILNNKLKQLKKFKKHSLDNASKTVKPNSYYKILSLTYYVNNKLDLTIYYSDKAQFNAERAEFLQRFSAFENFKCKILAKTLNYVGEDKYIERTVEKEMIYTGSVASTKYQLVAYVNKI